jgi:tetratricopeptide (TPR) repeat protein
MHHFTALPGFKNHVLRMTLHSTTLQFYPPFPAAILNRRRRAIHDPRTSYILKPAVTDTPTADSLAQRGLDLLAAGLPGESVQAFRAAIATDPSHVEAHHGLIRALRDAGQLNQSVGAAMALTTLTPNDPLAHTALSIALQHAGHIPQAEAAAARARILEWKVQLQSPPGKDSLP